MSSKMQMQIQFNPTAYMLASRDHYQILRHYSAEPADKMAMGCNTFLFSCSAEKPYCKPPFSHMSRVIDKIHWDRASAMLVSL